MPRDLEVLTYKIRSETGPDASSPMQVPRKVERPMARPTCEGLK